MVALLMNSCINSSNAGSHRVKMAGAAGWGGIRQLSAMLCSKWKTAKEAILGESEIGGNIVQMTADGRFL